MRSSRIMLLQLPSWLMIAGFALASIKMHSLFAESFRPDSGILCGNTVTDPLGRILSVGVPLGFLAIVPLGLLWNRGLASSWSLVPALFLVMAFTGSLLSVGIRYFLVYLPGSYLSDIVWWMRPVGRFLGV
jgi:hypothetical protein